MTDFKRYLRQVRQAMDCAPREKRRMAAHFRGYMLGFSEQSKRMGMDELAKEFGAPDEVARNYMDCLTERQKERFEARRRPVTVLFVILLLAMAVYLAIYWSNHNTLDPEDMTIYYQTLPPELEEKVNRWKLEHASPGLADAARPFWVKVRWLNT